MKRCAPVIFIVLLSLLLASCPSSLTWDDFDDVNLIAARNFDDKDADGEALWYFADGLTGGDVDFVVFEEVTSSVYGSLPTGATGPVYRYEIVNLFRNGDFEDANSLDGWNLVEDSTITTTRLAQQTNAEKISGSTSLELLFGSTEDRYTIDLCDTTYGLLDGFDADTGYVFHFIMKMAVSTVGFELNDNSSTGSTQYIWEITRGDSSSEDIVYQYPGTYLDNEANCSRDNYFQLSEDTSLTYLAFSGFNSTSQERVDGIFDDLRVIRANQAHYLRLSVPYVDSLDSDRPALLGGGVYTISVWVMPDPAVGSDNHIAAHLFSAGIDTTTADGAPALSTSVATEGPENLEEVTAWTKYSFDIAPEEVTISSDTDDDDTLFDIVFEIGSFYSGYGTRDAGTILLTDPSLEWRPN